MKHLESLLVKQIILDAEYYQPKYDELIEKLEATKKSISLGELLTYNQRGTQPIYSETDDGLPVLNSKHIRKNRIDFVDNRNAHKELTNKNSIIRKGDVLINGTGVGTIGRTAPYLLDTEALPDNHVTILRSDSIDPVFLSVMLNSVIGNMQVDKYYKGSSGQIELYPADLNEFIVWDAPKPVQQAIRNCIEEANQLEQQSQHLLNVAKQAVEIAIEQSEEAAMEFIKTQTQL